jgi:hypothetical protein
MFNDITVVLFGLITLGLIVFLISKNFKRAVQVMSGWGIYEIYNFSFDFIIWPILQSFYGWLGVVVLIIIALINNFIILLWYQRKKVDWFGVNEVEALKAKGHLWVHEVCNHHSHLRRYSLYLPAKILQLMLWLLNKNDIFAFVTLSAWQDSFITTIFLRHGRFDNLDRRDYIIFVSSTIFGCLVWGGLIQIVIMVAEVIFSFF